MKRIIIEIEDKKWKEIKEIFKIDKDVDEESIMEGVLIEGFGVDGRRGHCFESYEEFKKEVKIGEALKEMREEELKEFIGVRVGDVKGHLENKLKDAELELDELEKELIERFC